MAPHKKNTPATAPGLPADLEARLLEGQAPAIKADEALRNTLAVNVDLIDTSRTFKRPTAFAGPTRNIPRVGGRGRPILAAAWT